MFRKKHKLAFFRPLVRSTWNAAILLEWVKKQSKFSFGQHSFNGLLNAVEYFHDLNVLTLKRM